MAYKFAIMGILVSSLFLGLGVFNDSSTLYRLLISKLKRENNSFTFIGKIFMEFLKENNNDDNGDD